MTGTDTEIGKTTITVGLVSAVVKAGHTCVGLKPIAAGQDCVNGVWVNEDVLRLSQVCDPAISIDQVCSYQFRTPCAPEIAAGLEQQVIDKNIVLKHLRTSISYAQYAFVEGVGGFNIPLSSNWTTADLAVDLHFPIILVVGMRLGCVNHAMLTREAIDRRGLAFAGWVANFADPNFSFPDENYKTLQEQLGGPCLGKVPFLSDTRLDIAPNVFQLDRLLLE
ncbi:MAG: dethiobiotin synthase [Proteobacteria bacterium]|nr:dethiobiotin synthase [Pseudomonadota bacterium]